MGDEKNLLREVAGQAGGAVEAGRSIDDDVVKHAGDHVEQAGEVGGRGLDGGGN